MVANWSHLFPQRFGGPGRAGGDESHERWYRGNPDIYGSQEFFRRRGADQKKVLRGSMSERMIYSFGSYPFT
jgi:hypothetical protein